MTREAGEGAKGPDAFRTISEVAEELGLPQHVLRFWETRFPQIRPVKRGGGRRYYRPADVDLLRGVKQLLYGQGYTIRGVQRILREQGGRRAASAAGADVPAERRESDSPAGEVRVEPDLSRGLLGGGDGPDLWAPRMRRADVPESGPDPGPASHPGGPAPEEGAEPPSAPPGRLTAGQAERLATALSELQECRRLLGGRSQ